MRERTVVTLLLLVALLAGSAVGCQSSTAGKLGKDLSPEVVAKIKRGWSEQEVRELLGEPSRVTGMKEGRHMWTYRFVRVRQAEDEKVTYRGIPPEWENRYHGSVFVVFNGKNGVATVNGGENPR